ncbi:hypothetical protein DNC80_14295 [Flavobacterium sp. SOK18b]|uniref:hypothetical protein n=1 Tax=Flavobacterium sp. SOK18b TaxID=797900 RepID=UPI0015FAD640|nr:hypothetical protein [Flavobacterium sp. SOK18b]MBB1194837.1 hypothetical protein [Flavobacterium sp. SOK18b]
MHLADPEKSKIKMRAMIPGWTGTPIVWYSPQKKNHLPNDQIMDKMQTDFKKSHPLASRVTQFYFYCNYTKNYLEHRRA